MFHAITSFLAGIPFFSSAAFGISAMVIVGASWCLIGLVMGDAPKRGIEPSLVQLLGSFVSVSMSIAIAISTGAYPTGTVTAIILTCAAYAFGGASNFFMLQIMSRAMQSGPNGIIWAIIQSALVFPFIGGILFFGVSISFMRIVGIILLLAALALFAMTKNNSSGEKHSWKRDAFICLAICAIQQNVVTAPSYFVQARGVPSIIRSLSSAAAMLISALLYNLWRMNPTYREQLKNSIRNASLWKYIAALQFFNLIFAYTLLYPGMNVMADHDLGGMCYPVMVGSCIISFTVTSVVLLKEKMRPVQLAALAVCVAGLVFICTKA